MERFNRHMMALARDSLGLTQGDLAAQLCVQQGTISKYEGGVLEPSESFVDDMGKLLGFRPSFFFENSGVYGVPPYHFRKRKKLPVKALSSIVAEMNIRRIHLSILLRSDNDRSNGFIPEIDRDDISEVGRGGFSVETIAQRVREHWMLPNGPVDNLVDTIEAAGGIVVPIDFGTDLLDAMSQRIDGLPVLFFVNCNAPADRARHTLAHELGHMILHTRAFLDDEQMEEEADAFAGAFLLPAHEVRPQLRQFNLRQLANMKAYWKVSMAAIAVRASRLNLITPYQSKMFWIEMGKLGYRKREPNEPPKESPKRLRKLLQHHLGSLGYSRDELSKLLHLENSRFTSMYGDLLTGKGSDKPNLRLVT
jgi:Zn-dependent peptidase ImmA (M78 family)/transcriptional regulator with XRE-family HTH domain